MPTSRTKLPGGAEESEVIAFGPATGEDDFAGPAFPNVSHSLAGVVQERASVTADPVQAGRISVTLAEKRQHLISNTGIEGSGSVVVEVNGGHRERDSGLSLG